jgi:hypothetical protein
VNVPTHAPAPQYLRGQTGSLQGSTSQSSEPDSTEHSVDLPAVSLLDTTHNGGDLYLSHFRNKETGRCTGGDVACPRSLSQ